MNIEERQYPIGKFEHVDSLSEELISEKIAIIESLPQKLEEALENTSEEKLNESYREGGWTAKQVVHHIADSHMYSIIRFKHTLLEDKPTIKPYEENIWLSLADTKEASVNESMLIIRGVHSRWVKLLKSMTPQDFQKEHFHPEHQKNISLFTNLSYYAWHCQHHLAHIKLVTE